MTVTPTYHHNQGGNISSLLRELYAKPSYQNAMWNLMALFSTQRKSQVEPPEV